MAYLLRYATEYPNLSISIGEAMSLTELAQTPVHHKMYAAIAVILLKKLTDANYHPELTGINHLREVFGSDDFKNMHPIAQLERCQSIVLHRTPNFLGVFKQDHGISRIYRHILALNSNSINIDKLQELGSVIETFIISDKHKQQVKQKELHTDDSPQNKMDLETFRSKAFADDIKSYHLQQIVKTIFEYIADLSWPKIPEWLHVYKGNLSSKITKQLIIEKEFIYDAMENGWITTDEAKKYIELHDSTKEKLLQQLFNHGFELNNSREEISAEVQERLYALYHLIQTLEDQIFAISEKLSLLRANCREAFPQKPRYASLEYQSSQAGYDKISINKNTHVYQGKNRDGDFYTFNDNRLKYSNGWKIHLSVAHTDLEKAYELAAPILFTKKWHFKVINKSHIKADALEKIDNPELFALYASLQCYGTKQFTIYLEEKADKPVVSVKEIEEISSSIEKFFQENGISAGIMPSSDRPLKYMYFSMRNDQYEEQYISAVEVENNHNPGNRENPYEDLLAPSLKLIDVKESCAAEVDNAAHEQEKIRRIKLIIEVFFGKVVTNNFDLGFLHHPFVLTDGIKVLCAAKVETFMDLKKIAVEFSLQQITISPLQKLLYGAILQAQDLNDFIAWLQDPSAVPFTEQNKAALQVAMTCVQSDCGSATDQDMFIDVPHLREGLHKVLGLQAENQSPIGTITLSN